MRVVGTAGHVDHGKSTLVEALSGTHPDRLKEEKARQMTIDLGFAWVTLPDGQEVGIVDVPGHRDFIENMLAGVGGIDATLFVVAADEGVMPQTREHLAILDLLEVKSGIVVITKIDLIDDPQWLDLVEEEIDKVMKGTVLEGAPKVRVSALKKEGIAQLLATLASLLQKQPERQDLLRPRLPIDRVFIISGFGTVVTGTLLDGRFKIGEEVEVLPTGSHGRIRGLQTHKQKEDFAMPGSRTAINISGIEVDRIHRGEVVTHPGTYQNTTLVDVYFRLLKDARQPIKHNEKMKFFLGTSEVHARIRMMGKEAIQPGEEGWLQLDLDHPIVTVRGDRFILRRPSPAETLGGGEILDSHPVGRYKRFSEQVVQRYKKLKEGTAVDLLYQALVDNGVSPIRKVINASRLPRVEAQSSLNELLAMKKAILLETGRVSTESDLLITSGTVWEMITQQTINELRLYHRANPLRRGMVREELKSRLKLSSRSFQAALRLWIEDEKLEDNNGLLSLRGYKVQYNDLEMKSKERLLARFQQAPLTPPTIKECIAEVGSDVYFAMVDAKELIPVSAEVVFLRDVYESLITELKQYFQNNDTLTVAQFRDQWKTSRRYALAFLEHLDAIGLTIRDGDVRRLSGK